ncbi:MAG: AAA family ATPase, partial [Cyanobium sp.]
MARSLSLYVCTSCGAQTRQFFGRCSSCGSWNTLVEQAAAPAADGRRRRPVAASGGEGAMAARPRRSEPIGAVGERPLQRLASGYGELDRVLGGGLVPGSLVLVGGDPGIGKSTLLLQCARSMATRSSVLYVSAEESAQQVTLRWRRLRESVEAPGALLEGPPQPPVDGASAAAGRGSGGGAGLPPPAGAERIAPAAAAAAGLRLLAETDLELVLEELEALRPAVAIIDSIQALHDGALASAPG